MGSRILLADDSITIQKVVSLTFADEGLDVVSVSNGDQAERLLTEVNPDLVLADVFMPGKNGYELCEAIKHSPQFHHLPVVLLVGAFEPFDQAEARRVHADAHLTKPFESRALVDTVRNLINTSARPRTGPLPPLPPPETKRDQASETRAASQFVPPFAAPASTAAPEVETLPLPLPEVETLPLPVETNAFALSETTPLDISISPSEPAATGLPPESQFLPVDMMFETESNAPPAAGHSTDELSYASGNDALPFQIINVDSADEASQQPTARPSTAELAATHVPAHDAHSAAVPSQFGFSEDMILDFNPSEAPVTRHAPPAVDFDVAAPEALAVDTSGMLAETASAPLDTEEERLRTTLLAMPPSVASGETAIDTNPLEMPAPDAASSTTDFDLASPLGNQVDASLLFAADEPLGDVLEDETASPALEQPVEQAGSESAVGFEIMPQATLTTEEAQSQPAVSPPMTKEGAIVFESEVADASHVAEQSAVEAEASTEPPAAVDSSFVTGAAQAEDAAPFEWADSRPSESAFDFASPAAVEQAQPDDYEQPSAARDGKFSASTMWTTADAHFTAIDIEATPVEETELATLAGETRAVPDELAFTPIESVEDHATPPPVAAFDESSAMHAAETATSAEPSAATEPPVEQEAPRVDAAPVEQAAQGDKLSPALIDEIVRRVVAQMSDAVVREVAWEVVPDCVERVIKEMTQSELVKRM